MTLIDWASREQVDYYKLKQRCSFNLRPTLLKEVDISVIIPVRGRAEYHKIITEYFTSAITRSGKKIALTFVEHADPPSVHHWLLSSSVNHIFIPAQGKPFNKCLCHNIGALYGLRAKYYLFHDNDIIVPADFFSKLLQNLEGKDAVQSFTGRRLLLAGETITRQFLDGDRSPDFHNYSPHEIRHAEPGAPGGSICVTKEMLIEVGFWEDVFFEGYSVEDQFFFNKLKTIGNFTACDSPPIELIHLWHSSEHQNGTRDSDFVALDMLDVMNTIDRKAYMRARKEYFLKFFK